ALARINRQIGDARFRNFMWRASPFTRHADSADRAEPIPPDRVWRSYTRHRPNASGCAKISENREKRLKSLESGEKTAGKRQENGPLLYGARGEALFPNDARALANHYKMIGGDIRHFLLLSVGPAN